MDKNDLMSTSKIHIFKIASVDSRGSIDNIMVSKGECVSFFGWTGHVEATYQFKTADNEASVKYITLHPDGSYTIDAMMRNKDVPSWYKVLSHEIEDLHNEEEMLKINIFCKIHKALQTHCADYIHYDPARKLHLESINKDVDVEYFTLDCFGHNDIINYRTDHIKMNTLSIDDLNLVYKVCLCR